ncbi:Vacuolar protein sorting-associated protein 26A, partial [Goodea atripinnis]
VNLNVKQGGKRLEHQGIRIEFVGQIELFSDKSNTHEFVDLVKELALPGELTQNRSYDFEFMQVEKPYESYTGANVRLRIKIQHMELQLIKKEITGIGPSTTTETETVAKYEIMDGAPVKGESIPIRLFLAGQ